jgi:hypothetical protein
MFAGINGRNYRSAMPFAEQQALWSTLGPSWLIFRPRADKSFHIFALGVMLIVLVLRRLVGTELTCSSYWCSSLRNSIAVPRETYFMAGTSVGASLGNIIFFLSLSTRRAQLMLCFLRRCRGLNAKNSCCLLPWSFPGRIFAFMEVLQLWQCHRRPLLLNPEVSVRLLTCRPWKKTNPMPGLLPAACCERPRILISCGSAASE